MKIFLIIIGCISLALGLLGTVVPLMPTTPFLLLSAALFMRSSPRLYKWLINAPHLGIYIKNYRENRSMTMRAKVSSIILKWAGILYCIFVIAEGRLWLQLLLLVIATAVSWHILSLGTAPRNKKD